MNYEIDGKDIRGENLQNTIFYFKNELSEIQSRNEFELIDQSRPDQEQVITARNIQTDLHMVTRVQSGKISPVIQ